MTSGRARHRSSTLLMERLEQLKEQGNRPLIFSQFTTHLGLIREALDKAGSHISISTARQRRLQRQQRVEAFQNGEGDAFLISLKAGGTGLNLTAADYVIHMDPWWNPAVEDQATDRAHRIGQTRPVMVYRIIARGTIEEQILKMHDEKRDLVDGVLSGADASAKLSTKELAELIRSGGKCRCSGEESVLFAPPNKTCVFVSVLGLVRQSLSRDAATFCSRGEERLWLASPKLNTAQGHLRLRAELMDEFPSFGDHHLEFAL